MMLTTSELRHKRRALNATVEEFAHFLGMKPAESSYKKIQSWEEGKSYPSPSQAEFIAKIPTTFFQEKNTRFSFIDLFAGIGGIRAPFQNRGGKCVFTSEWDKFSQRTYAFNFGEIPKGDITKISAKDIPSHDVLLAGFPCQAFSQAGLRKGFSDTRGTLFFEIQRILAYHQPKFFLLENVKQLKGHDKGKTLSIILDVLTGKNEINLPSELSMSEELKISFSSNLNYDVGYGVLSSNNFGVPQRRERIYIIGFNKSRLSNYEVGSAQKIINRLAKYRAETSLGKVLEDSSCIDSKYTISDKLWRGHQRRLAEHRAKGNGFGFSLFNSNSNYCNTISARYYKDGSEVLIDQSHLNKNPRKLTPRECARVQGFPESFNLNAVSDPQIYKQFGNSVSMPVIDEIAKLSLKILHDG